MFVADRFMGKVNLLEFAWFCNSLQKERNLPNAHIYGSPLEEL